MKGDETVLLVVIVVMIAFVAATVLTVLNNRHRIAEMKAKAALGAGAETEQENELLRHEVGRLQQRIATLETIVTDPAERTAREIEQLR
jgi:signal transduction histidine kinase